MSGSRRQLKTSADDFSYDEYVNRNARQGSRRNNQTLPPLPNTATSRISRTAKSRMSTAASTRSNSSNTKATFRRDGYEQRDSRLGDDPLTEIRLMRAQMRRLALRSTQNERDVRSQFARQANRVLGDAEAEMERLQRRRTDAIINGDIIEARRVGREMKDLRAKAAYDAYADLLMSDNELASYGVNSKWSNGTETPNRRRRRERRSLNTADDFSNDRRTPRSRRRTSDTRDSRMNGRYIHSPPGYSRTPRDGRRARSQDRPFTDGGGRPLRRSRSFGRDERTGVKRNKRLADRPPPKTPPKVEKKPKTPKSSVPPAPVAGEVGVCPQCFDRNYSYTNEEVLKTHWNTQCPCLTRCEYCDQTVHVADLNGHHLTSCEFVKGTQQPCPLCGLAQYQGDSNHPRCPREPPPSGSAWCPLCSRAVTPGNSKDAWRKHLMDECYNNPRNHKRWAGRSAPTNGSSLLGGLDGIPMSVPIQQPSARPTGQMPSNFPVSAPNRPNLPSVPQNSPTNPQVAGSQRPGPLNPTQLRQAYQKLQEERRSNYEKQRALDDAERKEAEEEDV
ncbi:hypothetical protein M3Y94_00347700 [Aphelenchoides besseyi]|nr:hypothetical protein M3Y94_00347700 [Aphelenchoides besseyi]